MADTSHYLVSFENVSASVGGYDISSIVEFQLEAQANGIPTITLLVDAGYSGQANAPVVADHMTLGDARSVVDTCMSMVRTAGATLSFSVTVRSTGMGGSETQTLSLSGWMLTDVSLSPIQERGVCTASLTFMHPICKSHFGGAVPGLLSRPISYASLAGDNPLSVFVEALGLYGAEAERETPREPSVDGAPDQQAIRASLLGRLAKAKADLESSLAWSGGGLPAEAQLPEWGDAHRAGLAVYAAPSGGTSVFQRFTRGLVPECSLAIGGDFTAQKLEVGPFRPWADATTSIADSDIVSMQFPKHDPTPLSGVRLWATDSADGLPYSFHRDEGQSAGYPSDVFYVPASELSAEYMYGPIQQFQEPTWLAEVREFEMMRVSNARSDAKGATDNALVTAASVARDGTASFGSGDTAQASVDYASALLACGKAYYETSLMKDWVFEVTARLMFRSGGAMLCPGRVVSIKSGGKEAIAGYVLSVVHAVSVASGVARTVVTCSHPRFGGRPAGVTSGGNALYEI